MKNANYSGPCVHGECCILCKLEKIRWLVDDLLHAMSEWHNEFPDVIEDVQIYAEDIQFELNWLLGRMGIAK